MEIFHTIAKNPITSISIISILLSFVSLKIRQGIYMVVSRFVFLFIRRTYLHKTLGDTLVVYLQKNGYKCKRFTGELYGEDTAFIRSEKEQKHILYRDIHSNVQMFYGAGWPIFVSGTPLIQAKDTVKNYSYVLYTPRWNKKLIKILDEATELKNAKVDEPEPNRFVVKRVSGIGGKAKFDIEKSKTQGEKATAVSESEFSDPFSTIVPVKWDKDNIGQVFVHNTLETMSLNKELEDLLEEVKFWLDNRDWYEERGIPWKRGFLFYGKPGCGKTLMCRALAEHFNMPLIIFDLASMDSTEFNDAWGQLLPRRIALFEDFDTIFDKRTNIANSGLDFSTVLNALDGIEKRSVITIITTNHPEKLDEALGGQTEDEVKNGKTMEKMPSRPGRIDKSLCFLPLDRKGRMKLAMRIVRDEKVAEEIVDGYPELSAAQLQEKSFRVATDLLWEKRKAEGNKQTEHKPNGYATKVEAKEAEYDTDIDINLS
jgi:SpoVK/Ycf46/Vps4 family AAA+-type ATPase